MIITILVFVAVLGVLVLVHELGHFLVSKRNGVAAEEFGFGFPPRLIGFYKNKEGKSSFVFGSKKVKDLGEGETIYSLNLLPIGGFVQIKGQDGENKEDLDSFSSRSVWVRFKILFAGVGMNFVLAVFLFATAFWFGLPEIVEDDFSVKESKVQIINVAKNSPAEKSGLEIGDVITNLKTDSKEIKINKVAQLQDFIKANAGKEVTFKVIHAGDKKESLVKVNVREEAPEGEGLTGIGIARTAVVKHGILKSFGMAVEAVISMTGMMFAFLGDLIVKLFTQEKMAAEVAGPVGIAVLTGKMTKMGFAFVLQFAAMLSVNLAVINILPIPALDGGRILFLLAEKIKGKPVSEKVEGWVHMTGFVALITLMIFITFKDFAKFEILDKIKGLF